MKDSLAVFLIIYSFTMLTAAATAELWVDTRFGRFMGKIWRAVARPFERLADWLRQGED